MLSEPTHTPLPTFVLMGTFEKYKANNRQQNLSVDIEHVCLHTYPTTYLVLKKGHFMEEFYPPSIYNSDFPKLLLKVVTIPSLLR